MKDKYAMDTLAQAKLLVVITCILVTILIWLSIDSLRFESSLLSSVKSGERVLTCELYTGTHVIEPSAVEDFRDGRWYFTKGSASSCYLD